MGKRRIVLAATEFSTGGLGSYLVTVAHGLSARGWEVHLLATDHPGNLFAGIGGGLARHDISGSQLSVRKVRQAAQLLGRIAPDVMLLNHAALLHYTLPLLEVGMRPVAVIHSDDYRYYRTAALFQHRVFGWIAPSQGLAERFAPSLPAGRSRRVRVIPHGVDERFRTTSLNRSRHGGRDAGERDGVRIIFVGFLGQTKGADQLPAIMRRVWNASPSAHLTIVGEGPLRASVEAAFAGLGVPGRYRFTDSVPHDEVAQLLRKSDILLLPTQLEGFGLAIPEAMLSGCVPVVSRLTGVTDQIVDSGRTGFLVDSADSTGFADAVIRLAQDPALRGACAAAGLEAAELRFSTRRMLDGYEAFFAEDDDRGRLRLRSMTGWAAESSREVLRNGVDARWIGRRVRESVGPRS